MPKGCALPLGSLGGLASFFQLTQSPLLGFSQHCVHRKLAQEGPLGTQLNMNFHTHGIHFKYLFAKQISLAISASWNCPLPL